MLVIITGKHHLSNPFRGLDRFSYFSPFECFTLPIVFHFAYSFPVAAETNAPQSTAFNGCFHRKKYHIHLGKCKE